jgi:hypothetical protein
MSQSKRPLTEAALLLLLRMKEHFLCLQILNERLNSFDRKLIANCQGHFPMMLDPFVEFDASVTHRTDPDPNREQPSLVARLVRRLGKEIVHS